MSLLYQDEGICQSAVSLRGEVKKEHDLRTSNTHMEPKEAAERIREAFGL